MSSKLSLVCIVLALISTTTQLRLVKNNDVERLHNGVDFKKIVEHLDKHSNHHHAQHTKGTPANLLNIQNLNLFLSRDNGKFPLRAEIQEKLCQVGRCGCSGYRCNDDRDNNDERSEQDQENDQLEKVLRQVDQLRCSSDRCQESLRDGEDRCGCRHKGYVREGDRCGCQRSDDGKDDRCGCRPRSDDREDDEDDTRSERNLKSELERYGKKYKINNELDAIVLDIDQLRCSSDRCQESLRDGEDRCGCRHKGDVREGDRCGCQRSDDGEDDRCGCRPRSDDREDDEDDEEDQALRCKNNRCGGKGDTRSERNLKSELERYGKKYKINNELDAIVLDLSNLNGLLGNLNHRNERNIKKQSLSESAPDLDLDYYFSLDDDDKSERSDDDIYVIDVDQNDALNLEDALLGQQKKRDSSKSNIFNELYEANQINDLNKAWNYVKNRRGDKDLSSLTRKQKYYLQKLKSQNQYGRADQIDLWSQVKKIVLNSDQDKSRAQLQNFVQGTKGYNYRVRDLRTKKRLFPLTVKQKLKLQKKLNKSPSPLSGQAQSLSGQAQPEPRRVVRETEQYGVPFELQIEGLGEVKPE